MAMFFAVANGNSQVEFICDSIGISEPFNLVTTFDPPRVGLGTQVCIDFSVENFETVLGTQGTITFDPTQLLWVSSTSTLTGPSSVNFNNNSVANGQLSYLWTDTQVQGVSLDDGTSFIELCFVVTGEPGETIELFLNSDLAPAFPESGVLYQTNPTTVCDDTLVLLNGDNLASITIECTEPTITNISSCASEGVNGFLSFQVCGGEAPYSVMIENTTTNDSQSATIDMDNVEQSFNGLFAGEYQIDISDSNGVFFDATVNIVSAQSLSFDLETIDPSCFYTNNGSFTVSNYAGGTPPYSVQNSNGLYFGNELESTFANLPNGDYYITVTDDSGCALEDSVSFDVPEFIFVTQVDAATCAAINDGYISVSITGGTPFPNNQYLIEGVLTNFYETFTPATDSNFDPQTQNYTLAVEDANGCIDGVDLFLPYLNNVGDPCDDGDPMTSNDVIQQNCTCAGIPPLPLQYLGNPTFFLPTNIEVTIEDCQAGFTFDNGVFENFETSTTYPFPLEDGVHFVGTGGAAFQSTHTPSQVFPEGVTNVFYVIVDSTGTTLNHTFDVIVNCTGCSTLSDLPVTCTSAVNSNFFSCDIGSLLDGFSACNQASNGSTQTNQPNPLCNGNGAPENVSWFAFVAGSNSLTIDIVTSDCQAGATGSVGLEVGVYDACAGTCIAGDADCDSSQPDAINLTNLSAGKIYYLFIDGCEGSICKYAISVSNFENFSLPIPEEVSFSTPIATCQVLGNRFCADCEIEVEVAYEAGLSFPSELDAEFVWTVNPAINGQTMINHNFSSNGSAFPTLNAVPAGTYAFCLFQVITECDSWSSVLCAELIVEDCDVIDVDMDGFAANVDCNDNDPAVNPGATEVCDGIDNNCDGEIDEGLITIYYQDTDQDGFGSAANSTESCTPLNGFVENGDDCDDGNPAVFPGAEEVCDGEDNNCDGMIDEGLEAPSDDIELLCSDVGVDFVEFSWTGIDNASQYILSYFVSGGAPTELTQTENSFTVTGLSEGDIVRLCVIAESSAGCQGEEFCLDCETTNGFDIDNDGDGVLASEDCDDNDPANFPGNTEICDGQDNNCDGEIDEGLVFTTYYSDNDMDGFGEGDGFEDCLQPPDTVTEGGDCDDSNPDVYPGAPEILGNGIDDNCDGIIDNMVSVNELDGPQYVVYPNPTLGQLIIDGFAFSKIEIVDRLGRTVKVSIDSKIDISTLENGLYLLKVFDLSNKMVGITKVIKN